MSHPTLYGLYEVAMADKTIHSVGRYTDPADRTKPYWVKVNWFEGYRPVEQPVTEGEFFMLLGRIFAKYGPIVLDVEMDPS